MERRMSDYDDEKAIADLDKAFDLLTVDPAAEAQFQQMKKRDADWKRTNPDSYKEDMANMCRDMFGERWEIEYQAMLREEFPQEFD
jgi:hypothetical protein